MVCIGLSPWLFVLHVLILLNVCSDTYPNSRFGSESGSSLKPSSTVSNAMVSLGDQSQAVCPPRPSRTTVAERGEPSHAIVTLTAKGKSHELPIPSASKSVKATPPVFECLENEGRGVQGRIEEPDFETDGESEEESGNRSLPEWFQPIDFFICVSLRS